MVILIKILWVPTVNSTTVEDKKEDELKAQKIIFNETISEYKEALSELLEESNDKEIDISRLKEIGKLHFFIGEAIHDHNSIEKAISIFKTVLEKNPNDAEIKAFLGSAYTVKSRDFPLKWLMNITPAGFVRIYYVKKGINMINQAVKTESMNPVIRMIRGQTFTALPKSFLQFETGIKDLELLLSWIENPLLNSKYSGIIMDKGFILEVLYHSGEAYFNKGETKKAKELFKKVISINPDTPLGKIAQLRLNEM